MFSEEQGRSTCVPSFEGDYDVMLACTMPAVCFCANKKTAQACCILLQKVATLYGADPTRIKVLDADTKNCKGWHSRFSYDPNKYAHHCDILFATSVIGAGFSIDTHFVHFYAILFNNILTHIEEQQLIGRLRYILQDFSDASIERNIPEKDRVSLMYISPGHGSMLSLQWFEKDIEKIKRTTMATRGASQIKRRRITKHSTDTKEVAFQEMLENRGNGMLRQLQDATNALQVLRLNTFAWHHLKWMDWFVNQRLRSCCLDFPPDKREEQARADISLFDFGEECPEKSRLIDKSFMNWANRLKRSILHLFLPNIDPDICPELQIEYTFARLELGGVVGFCKSKSSESSMVNFAAYCRHPGVQSLLVQSLIEETELKTQRKLPKS